MDTLIIAAEHEVCSKLERDHVHFYISFFLFFLDFFFSFSLSVQMNPSFNLYSALNFQIRL